MFSCLIISYKCDLHLGSQFLSLMNIKNQPNGQKNSLLPCGPFGMNYVIFKRFCIIYDPIKYI